MATTVPAFIDELRKTQSMLQREWKMSHVETSNVNVLLSTNLMNHFRLTNLGTRPFLDLLELDADNSPDYDGTRVHFSFVCSPLLPPPLYSGGKVVLSLIL
jgi:hypothetical protein